MDDTGQILELFERVNAILKQSGWVAYIWGRERNGVADLGNPHFLVSELWERDGQRGDMLAILLTPEGGIMTSQEKTCLDRLDARGWLVGVCCNLNDVIEMLSCVQPRNGRLIR